MPWRIVSGSLPGSVTGGRRRRVSRVLLDREEADRPVHWVGPLILAAAAACRLANSPGGVGRPWASTSCRARSTRRTAGGVPGATLRGGRRDGSCVGPPRAVRFLPRRRLLSGPELGAASRRGLGCFCAFQPRCHAVDARIPAHSGAFHRGWRVEGGDRDALADWEMLSVEPAETTGLGWPLTRTAPRWYRLRRRA